MSHDRRTTEPGELPEATTDEGIAEIRRRCLRAVTRYCPAWLADRREDIAQVATLRFLEIRERDEGRRFSPAYLDRVAYGCTIDEMRRQRRRLDEVAVDEDRPAASARPPAVDPERATAAREIGRGILDCLETLVRPRRRAVTLYLLGHPVPSIGRLLGWSTRKAESLVYRGLENLRRCLRRKGWAP